VEPPGSTRRNADQIVAQAVQSAALVAPEQFDRFRQHIDPVWVEEAVVATGFASIRRRRLPAD